MRTLAIIGVGLIGGSIALAARARGMADRIIGVGPSSWHLEQARQRGMLDDFLPMLDAAREADIAVICTPVNHIAGHAAAIAEFAKPGTLITDVGSTKAEIIGSLIEHLELQRTAVDQICFVGGHPLAGSEKSGPQFADAKLFENRLVVLTPDEHFHPGAVKRATQFWQALGAQVKLMTAKEHDQAVAMTSHLPHLIAAALAAIFPDELRELAASGFRATTRVAGGDPAMWEAIFGQNREALSDSLDKFVKAIVGCQKNDRSLLDMKHIHDLLIQGKRNRDALGS